MSEAPKPQSLSRRNVLKVAGAVVAAPLLVAEASAAPWGRFDGEAIAMPRRAHAAVGLEDGRVVVIGGFVGEVPTDSVQLYDPASGAWADLPSLRVPRARHAAALLRDGRLVVLGGVHTAPLDSIEVYDPRAGRWEFADPLPAPLRDPTVAVSGSNLVVVGGSAAFAIAAPSDRSHTAAP